MFFRKHKATYITELGYFEFLPSLLYGIYGQNQFSHSSEQYNYIFSSALDFFYEKVQLLDFISSSCLKICSSYLITIVIFYILSDNIIITFWLYLVSAFIHVDAHELCFIVLCVHVISHVTFSS